MSIINFSGNYLESSAIHISSSVGSITFDDWLFSSEIIKSGVDYISIANPHTFESKNVTFVNSYDDGSDQKESILLVFESIDISQVGEINIVSITFTNWTSSLFHLYSLSGKTQSTKAVNINSITVKDINLNRHNDLIVFGPLYSDEDIKFTMQNVTFSNLNFSKNANIIYLKQQTLNPFILENSYFENIIGGRILLEPDTSDITTLPATLNVYNLNVANNDFKDNTFIDLKQHSQLIVSTWAFYKNSATFWGTLISITNDNSVVNITNCNFNNNNGMTGGILYVDGQSTINVYNSTFYNNFAVSASISYVSNEGNIHFSKCIFNYNHAVSVGLIDIIGSAVESSIESSSIYSNEIVSAADVIKELDDRTHWRYLWFAADTYVTYLNNNRNQLSLAVSKLY